jgi:hypothetical protein
MLAPAKETWMRASSAALPRTQREDELIGEAWDQRMQEAQVATGDAVHTMQELTANTARVLMNRNIPFIHLRLAGAVVLLVAGLVSGCGVPVIKEATKQATAGAMEQGLGAFEEERMRQRVADIVASPEMQKAMRDIAAGFTNGVTGSLTNEETVKRISVLTNVVATTAARAAVDSALAELVSPSNEKRMEEMAVSTATAATRAAMQEMNAQVVASMETFGPGLRTALSEDVASGVRDVLTRPELQQALAATAFELARQVVLGTNQGTADLEQRHKKVGTVAKITGLLAEASWLLPVLLAGALATIVVLIVRMRRQTHRVA